MTPQRLTVIFAMLLAFPVSADDLVDRADANGDGYVSLYELRAAYYADMEFNQRIEQSFAEYDTDGDGLISEAERRAQAAATAPAAATPAGTSSAPPAAAVTTSPAGLAPTPPAGLSAAQATETPAAETASVRPPGMDTGAGSSAGRSPEVAPATTTAAATSANVALPDTRGLSRSELWIEEIDVDNSGGASISELVASGDGSQWFADSDFASADENGDGDLDPDELEVLIQSMERRRR